MTDNTANGGPVTDRVRAAFRRIAEVDRPEVWISLRPEAEVLLEAADLDRRLVAGEVLPLAGTVVAVKDNIDVQGLPTTAGCSAFAYRPGVSAPAVQRLVEAGSVILGKTNLDQFATGLVGTRSPYGAVRGARDPERVSGGSSSGSAVAVALGITDFALGTDTAGSGRVPAAFGGIVGLKPTRGLIPNTGVVPACRSLDCVSVFATTVGLAARVAGIMTGPDDDDPLTYRTAPYQPLAASAAPRVAVPRPEQLHAMSNSWRAAFAAAVDQLVSRGVTVVEIDISALLDAGSLLYGGAFVAERYAAVGEFISDHRAEVDPTVGGIVAVADAVPAWQLVVDTERLDRLKVIAARIFHGVDALMMPTVSEHPTIAEVAAGPVVVNSRLGGYTTFCNLLDLCAIAVPAGEVDGGFFGVSLIAPAFHDAVVADLAELFHTGAALAPEALEHQHGIGLVVVGAHLSGLPLNYQLQGARLIGPVQTAPSYRMYALDTVPAKPGLIRVASGGVSVLGELWKVPPPTLARLLAGLPSPMALGPVELLDGSVQVGFQCEPVATSTATDISDHAGWVAYLGSGA